MKQSINYITVLPDFIEMQRVSFCWFISHGLSEELTMFSRVYDFTYNIEYVLFGYEDVLKRKRNDRCIGCVLLCDAHPCPCMHF